MNKKIIILLVCFCFFSTVVKADRVTHAMGNTSYMLREAMMLKAHKYDSQNYEKALFWQSQAKKALRGELLMKIGSSRKRKKIRSSKLALEYTKKAYALALLAKNNALAAQGKRF